MRVIKVVTAEELSAELKGKVEKVFSKKLKGDKLEFRYSADPSLLGGILVTDGETIYDGTVLSQLEKMKRSLL